jgi:Ni/Fe-hydrogenase 1 B-type cytochrome subunit
VAHGAEGVGLTEAPRGALAHYIKIKNGAIDNYQLVVPTTWNGSPRDAKKQRSSFEQALIGTPVAKTDEPVEILRTIHSFDPCLACAVHLYDPQGRHLQPGFLRVTRMSAPSDWRKQWFAGAPEQPVEYRRVYVWELPVRVYHWINAVALVLLCVTGYLIGAPFVGSTPPRRISSTGSAGCGSSTSLAHSSMYSTFWRGSTGDLSETNTANWAAFFPLKPSQRQEIVDVIKSDVLETKLHGPISTGHNALAGLIYFFTFLAFVAQTITGFALYSSMSNSWLPRMFVWIVPLMGGDFGVRFWHHLFLWFFVTFIIVHVYLAFYHDYIEGRGTVSSIIGGWKFEREKKQD